MTWIIFNAIILAEPLSTSVSNRKTMGHLLASIENIREYAYYMSPKSERNKSYFFFFNELDKLDQQIHDVFLLF